jgi:addiction module HigA family antidote
MPKNTYPFCPDWGSTPPGATIADLMEELGWSEIELAQRLQCSTDFVVSLLNGETNIDKELAVKLENVLGSTANFWLRREALYREDLELERQGLLYTARRLIALQYQIRQFHRRKIIKFKPNYLEKLARTIAHKANTVQNSWTTLPADEQESWRKLAYEIIDAEPIGFFGQIRVRTFLIYLRVIGHKKAFDDCAVALDRLVDNILDAIEREDPRYEEMLVTLLDDIFSLEPSENIQKGETRDWFNSLLD